MAYTEIDNGDTGLEARGKINGIGNNLDSHSSSTGSSVHGLGTISVQSASAVAITGGSIVSQYATFGTSTDNSKFEADGTLIFSGSATVWDDIFFPLVTAKQGQTDKPAFSATELAYLFPQADTSNVMYIVAQMPHSKKPGSDLSPHVHWKQTQSGSVVFKMDYKWFPIGGSIPATWDTYIMATPAITYTSGSIHQINYGSHISGSIINETDMGISSMMLIKLYRDDNTYTGDAITYQFDIHYLKDGVGSHTEYMK